MSKKDYTKFSKNQNGDVDTPVIESVPEVTFPIPEDDMPEEQFVVPITETADTPVEQKPEIFGKVVDCSKLNVRQYPTLRADVLCTLVENAEIEIDEGKSTDEFYAICTPTGLEGFCLKKFVKICK